MKTLARLIALIGLVGLLLVPPAAAQTENEAVVQAVLFYSPTCPHCHEVIETLIIPMVEEYGNQLQVLGVNVSEEQGQALYQLAIEQYQIPPTRLGVPTLIVADAVLVGSGEIPAQFPEIVETGLATGGIPWPDLPGLVEPPLHSNETAPTSETDVGPATEAGGPAESAPAAAEPEMAPVPGAAPAKPQTTPPESIATIATIDEGNIPSAEAAVPPADPLGIALASLVLMGMVGALGYAGKNIASSGQRLWHLSRTSIGYAKSWAVPILSLIGLGVASYLAYVEINQIEAVCGPVGNCNVVQTSPYAQIGGIPIAVLGMLNYLALIILWAGYRFGSGSLADLSLLGLLGLTVTGTLFSIYLTLLEIFVIQAVCLWCISSAIVTALLMVWIAASVQIAPPRRTSTA